MDFLPEKLDTLLTDDDWWQLKKRQLARYKGMFAQLVGKCACFLSPLNNSLILIAYDAESVEALLANIVELRFEAYAILSVERLAITFSNAVVYNSNTLPCLAIAETGEDDTALESGTKLESNSLFTEDLITMTTSSTLVAPMGVETTVTNASVQMPSMELGIPMMQNLSDLASRAGIDINYAVKQLRSLDLFVGWNVGGYYETTDTAWGAFSDFYASSLKSLLSGGVTQQQPVETVPTTETIAETDNGAEPAVKTRAVRKTTARKAPTATKPARTRSTAAQTSTVSTRFKTFDVSNKTAVTLGNFLAAQRYGDTERVQMIEAIASAPEISNPDEVETLTERVIDRIMKACKRANKRISRAGIIKSAAEMRGEQP